MITLDENQINTARAGRADAMLLSYEQQIVGALVDDVLAAGHRIAVSLERGFDLDGMLLGSTDRAAIMEAAFAGDDAHLFIQPATGPTVEDGQVVSDGWVYLVMGNGRDVISDYTTNMENLLDRANRMAEG